MAKASTMPSSMTSQLKLAKTEEQATNLVELLHEVARSSVQISDWRDFLTELLAATNKGIDADRGFLALVDEDSGELTIHAVSGAGWTEAKREQRLQIAARRSQNRGWRMAEEPPTERRIGITFHTATTGETYITGNVVKDPYHSGFFPDVVSEVAVPIRNSAGIILGVMNLQSRKPDHFTKERVSCLEAVANLAATRIIMARYQARQTALVEFGKDIYSIVETPALLQRVVDIAADLLRFEDCSLFMLDRERSEIVLMATRGPLIDQIGTASYPLGLGLTGWVAKHGVAIRTSTPNTDPRWQGRFLEIPTSETGAYLAVPIPGRVGSIGVLRVLRRRTSAAWFRSEFTEDDEAVLLTIASQLGSALDNIRMLDRLVTTERMAAWGEMSARAAHMIGNRTFAIKGDLNELQYVLKDPNDRRDEFKQLAASIGTGISRLEEILQEFRDFVRATQINIGDCNINELVRQCVAENFPKRSNIVLTESYADDLPPVPADAPRLKRALSELVENAVSFMPEGGKLTVKTSIMDGQAAQETFGLSRSRRYVCLEFVDTGPGVPENQKTKIFTPFYTTRAKGMGLGLSIVKGIIDAHHGAIQETGQSADGARFDIALPVKAGA
jgi:signal transduction histidine kinase